MNFFQGIFPILVSSVVVSALLYILWILWPVSALWGSFILHGTVLVGIYSILMFVFVLNGFEKELLLEIYNSFFHFIDNKKKGIEEIM